MEPADDRMWEVRGETILPELRQRIRDVRQGPDGLIYILTEESDGAVLRLEPARQGTAGATPAGGP